MGRKNNPRPELVRELRDVKALAGGVIGWMTTMASRELWETTKNEQGRAVGVNRLRRPEEHIDNRPRHWLAARQDLRAMMDGLVRADRLARYKLADLGCDARGVHIGREQAMERLIERASPEELEYLRDVLKVEL